MLTFLLQPPTPKEIKLQISKCFQGLEYLSVKDNFKPNEKERHFFLDKFPTNPNTLKVHLKEIVALILVNEKKE